MKWMVRTDMAYSFGFTGFKPIPYIVEEEPEPFDEFVHEIRVEAGLEEERRPTLELGDKVIGQILWSGKITIPAPKFHRTLRNIITDDSTRSDK
jgi:hypothetical protein